MCFNGVDHGWQCMCDQIHSTWEDAFYCHPDLSPEFITKLAKIRIKQILFRNPILSGVSQEIIDDMDARAADGEEGAMEFTWRENPSGSGKYDLNPIGIINGFLALENRTLFLKQNERDLEDVGFGIADDTRFLEPSEPKRYFPEPARYEDIEDEYRTPEGLTKIAEDIAQTVLMDIPLIFGVPADKIEEMDKAARENKSFDRMEFEWVKSKTEEGKYDLFLIGMLNGFLLESKQRIMPVMLHLGEKDEGRFAGIMVVEEDAPEEVDPHF